MAPKRLPPSRLTEEQLQKLFPPAQRAKFQPGWLPTLSTAAFLKPPGPTLGDIINARADMANDKRHDLVRELTDDELHIQTLRLKRMLKYSEIDRDVGKLIKRTLNRQMAPSIMDVTRLHGLPKPARTASEFRFTPFSVLQRRAMEPIAACKNAESTVPLQTFEDFRNLLNCEYSAVSALRVASIEAGDPIVYTRELVYETAAYLSERVRELKTQRPILTFFGSSGRFAQLLNETNMIPVDVIAVNPRLSARIPMKVRSLRLQEAGMPNGYYTEFPSEKMEVFPALKEYQPSIVLVEPYSERDYLCELRGFHSVREVMCLGVVDSPSFGSTSFPWLSWGVRDGPSSYLQITDNLRVISTNPMAAGRSAGSPSANMSPAEMNEQYGAEVASQIRRLPSQGGQEPMDAPYVAQGYERMWIHDISKFIVMPNDSTGAPNQGRCLTFRRTTIPEVKGTTLPSSSSDDGGSEQKTDESPTARAA